MRLLFESLAITVGWDVFLDEERAIKDGRKMGRGGKKGVRNGIMFARWPFYPLTMIPPVSSKLYGRRGVRPTVDVDEREIYPIHFVFR